MPKNPASGWIFVIIVIFCHYILLFLSFYDAELAKLPKLSFFKQFAGREDHRINNSRHSKGTTNDCTHLKIRKKNGIKDLVNQEPSNLNN